MEYKRSDMYVQAGRGKKSPRREMPAVVKSAELELEAELAVEITVEKVEERYAAPPAIELPQEETGVCFTTCMSYVPVQKWGKLYEPEEALERGTIFPELDYPFLGKGGCK